MTSRVELAVGLIDSGVAGPASRAVLAQRDFPREGKSSTGAGDLLGHGSAVAGALLRQAPGVELYSARVFGERLTCSAAQVAAALDWLVSCEVRLVNMSFGLRENRAVLEEACVRASRAGVILLASAPARGDGVFPASYPDVISATGDARCSPAEISEPGTGQAEFGGHVRCPDSGIAGASVACAFVSAHCAAYLQEHPAASADQVRDWLRQQASYRGLERRTWPGPAA